jgi:hypothetical protein
VRRGGEQSLELKLIYSGHDNEDDHDIMLYDHSHGLYFYGNRYSSQLRSFHYDACLLYICLGLYISFISSR